MVRNAMSTDMSLRDRIEEILKAVSSETGMKAALDRYPCFLRVGDDWGNYPFSWEPFRDLAGPLEWPENAPPIVVVSRRQMPVEAKEGVLPEPLVETLFDPHPYVRITVSSAMPVASIVNRWIAQISGHFPQRPLARPQEWFFQNLRLAPEDVTPAVRQFLGLEPPGKSSIGISASVRSVASGLGTSKVSAFAIVEKLRKLHGEYASNRLGQFTAEVPADASFHEWEIWRDSVAGLYDEAVLKKSHHSVIDGRLLLAGLGLLEKPLREALEQADVWAPLLLEIDEAALGPSGPLRDALNAIQLAHGYHSDRPDGDDKLGIAGEVNALCEVMMDPDVTPPLAVGLFGAWGTGKSFFMEKMRHRVHELAREASGRSPKNVVQIRFNAWHYADTSLWASLAVEIFERLADPEPVEESKRQEWLRNRGDSRKAERETLLTQLETYRQARAALEKERANLQLEQKRLEQKRLEAENARRDAIASASLTNVAAELMKDPDVKAGLQGIGTELGLTPAVTQLASIGRELQTASGYLTATWRQVRNKTWTIGLLSTSLVLLVLTSTSLLKELGSWLGTLAPAIGSVVSVVVAASRQILPAAKSVNNALSHISATVEKVTEVEERLTAKRRREEQALELELARHNEQVSQAGRSLAALDEKIASITAQADALTTGRRLYDFLADRAAGYQKHQGVIGMLHRDFRFLDAMLRAQDGAAPSGLPRIDRVVLYIDDLDRCAPAKVLEVLEAVHLLLALELFIVVVGVDPRWLKRSLSHQYRDLCLTNDLTKDPYIQTMPTEYLEKIFQIPLTLPAMEVKAYGNLISSLAPTTAVPDSPPAPEISTGPARRVASPDTPGGSRVPTRALLKVQEGSAAQGRGGRPIDLTSEEVRFIQRLSGLVHTPRAAKRLMNTYRLIRATQHVGSRSRFLGADGEPGEYYAVLTLLAVAAGYPTLADQVLVALEEDAEKHQIVQWSGFLGELNPAGGKLLPAGMFPPNPGDVLARTTAAEWENMFEGLMSSLPGNLLTDLEPYRRWGRTVARFSFTL